MLLPCLNVNRVPQSTDLCLDSHASQRSSPLNLVAGHSVESCERARHPQEPEVGSCAESAAMRGRSGVYLIAFIALALLNASAFKWSPRPGTVRAADRSWRSLAPRMSAEDTDVEAIPSANTINSETILKKGLVDAVEGPSVPNVGVGVGVGVGGKTVTTEDFIDLDGDFIASLKVRRPYISILAERLMQTVDDYQLSQTLKKSFPTSTTRLPNTEVSLKERIVVLGTGWGGHAFLKTIDATKYDVTIISPRNYFTFTPMLAASAVGTVEFRSICEPIRNVNPLANYLEAAANSIDLDNKKVSCLSIKCQGTACDVADFEVDYDYLVLAVGATVNTFGIKGVKEHCQFLKQVEDAVMLRKAIASCFERANIPNLPDEEIRAALSFVSTRVSEYPTTHTHPYLLPIPTYYPYLPTTHTYHSTTLPHTTIPPYHHISNPYFQPAPCCMVCDVSCVCVVCRVSCVVCRM
jgi:hypothetical protein